MRGGPRPAPLAHHHSRAAAGRGGTGRAQGALQAHQHRAGKHREGQPARAPERASQAREDAYLSPHIVNVLRLLLGCTQRGDAAAVTGRFPRSPLLPTAVPSMQQAASVSPSVQARAVGRRSTAAAGDLAGKATRDWHARETLGMSSVLDTDLHANSMPLLRSTAALRACTAAAGPWLRPGRQVRGGSRIQRHWQQAPLAAEAAVAARAAPPSPAPLAAACPRRPCEPAGPHLTRPKPPLPRTRPSSNLASRSRGKPQSIAGAFLAASTSQISMRGIETRGRVGRQAPGGLLHPGSDGTGIDVL